MPALLGSQGQSQAGSSAAGAESSARPESSSSRILRALLFASLSTEVSPTDMEVIREYYHLFQTGKMTPDNFVKMLRSIVGDASLRAILPGFKSRHNQNLQTL